MLDVMKGNLLGEHALAMIVVIFIVSKMHRRLRLYSMWQQSLAILIFSLIYLGIIYLIQGAVDQLPNNYYYWGASVTSMIFWPWIYSVLQNSQRKVQTS
jgi:rod shape-determining protein MreD